MVAKNWLGVRIKNLIVVSREGVSRHKHILWKCRLDCGHDGIRTSSDLAQTIQRGLGFKCSQCSRTKESIPGKRYGRLVVVRYAGHNYRSEDTYETQCDCGKTVVVCGPSLRRGNTKSCGCLKKEIVDERLISRGITHGLSKHPLYATWNKMNSRCTQLNEKNYANYGGRGIKVCQEWSKDNVNGLTNFVDYIDSALGEKPSPVHQLDRWPDNNGNYQPGNVRWATPTEQNNNTRQSERHRLLSEAKKALKSGESIEKAAKDYANKMAELFILDNQSNT